MRELEMRTRVERFLQSRLRSMVLPATLGLGLAIGGCNGDGLSTDDGGDPSADKDAGKSDARPVAVYSAPAPDAAPKMDSGMAVRYMAQMPDADLGGPVAMYMSQYDRR